MSLFCLTFGMFARAVLAEISQEKFTADIVKFSSESDPRKHMVFLEDLLEDASKYQRFIILPKLTKTAIEIGLFAEAENYANELLLLAEEFETDWNYGNAIHDANIILGMVSLHSNQIKDAKSYLLEAGKSPGSPQLRTLGPNMMLAEPLLEKGEKRVVIEYFELLKKVWEHDDGRLDSWIAAVKGGGKPYFEPNLLY